MNTPLRLPLTVFAFYAVSFAQSGDFATKGKVTANGQPLRNATVTYMNLNKRLSWDFTDANGVFGPLKLDAGGDAVHAVPGFAPRVAGDALLFSVPAARQVAIDIFTLNGRKTGPSLHQTFGRGSYRIRPFAGLSSPPPAKTMYVVKVSIGPDVAYVKMHHGSGRSSPAGTDGANGGIGSRSGAPWAEVQAARAVDTVRIGKTGYTPHMVPISDYSEDIGTVTLQAIDIESKVSALLAQMSQGEKVGQIQFPTFGTITSVCAQNYIGAMFDAAGSFSTQTPNSSSDRCDRYQKAVMGAGKKIPIMFGWDAVHGNLPPGSTVFPHNMGIGAIQDYLLVQKAYRVTALESRGYGMNWALAPCVAVPQDDRWGRCYEGYSESTGITKKLVPHAILGFQTTDLSLPVAIAATTKHFAGDGGTKNGEDRGNTVGDDAALRAIHLPAYEEAIAAGTATIMPSFSAWNGLRMHINAELMTNWLKKEKKFDGFLVGDWAADMLEGVTTDVSIKAGLDMPMAPGRMEEVKATVNSLYSGGAAARCDDAVKRILRVKYRMDLFTNYLADKRLSPFVGCEEHRAVARACVRKSLVLLKNETKTLPLPKNANVAIWGPHADDMGYQCGGWTVSFEGSSGPTTKGTTIRQGIESVCTGSKTYSLDGSNGGNAEYIIACIGEKPYAEKTFYDISLTSSTTGAPQNAGVISRMTAAKTAGKKVIAVVFFGRPLDLNPIMNNTDAIVIAWLPGTEGRGVAEVLFQEKPEYNFEGKLPFTMPKNLAQEPINAGDGKEGLFPLGFGLSY